MNTIAELKAAFYDSQRQASNLFEALVGEVLALNEKAKQPLPVAEKVVELNNKAKKNYLSV